MKLPLSIAVCLLAASLTAEIIDRIAVSVGNQVITTSDIDREIRITAFLNGSAADFSSAARKAAADRMVEQRLVLRELQNNRYPEPAPAEVEPALDDFKKKNYPAVEDYTRELAGRGIAEQEVKDQLLWQRRLLTFLDIRFKPGVMVSAQDVQNYFTKEVAPKAAAQNPEKPITLEEVRDQIQAKLSDDMANQQMDAWLENSRRRSQIVFHPEAFQ